MGKGSDVIELTTRRYFVFHFLLFVFDSTRRGGWPPPSWPAMMVRCPSRLVFLAVLVLMLVCLDTRYFLRRLLLWLAASEDDRVEA